MKNKFFKSFVTGAVLTGAAFIVYELLLAFKLDSLVSIWLLGAGIAIGFYIRGD